MNEEALLLWVRVGEAGNYIASKSITELRGVRPWHGQFTGWKRFGFETDTLKGVDYVSLYWGNAAGDPVRYLTPEEKKQIEEILK